MTPERSSGYQNIWIKLNKVEAIQCVYPISISIIKIKPTNEIKYLPKTIYEAAKISNVKESCFENVDIKKNKKYLWAIDPNNKK